MTQPTFRTSDETNRAVRLLTADVTSELGGEIRVVHDELIANLVKVGREHFPELVALFRTGRK
jgi:PHP family Zn ribbon phosphoesterase